MQDEAGQHRVTGDCRRLGEVLHGAVGVVDEKLPLVRQNQPAQPGAVVAVLLHLALEGWHGIGRRGDLDHEVGTQRQELPPPLRRDRREAGVRGPGRIGRPYGAVGELEAGG